MLRSDFMYEVISNADGESEKWDSEVLAYRSVPHCARGKINQQVSERLGTHMLVWQCEIVQSNVYRQIIAI